MRAECGYGNVHGTISKSGNYTNIQVQDLQTGQKASLRVHKDAFRLGYGMPRGFCAYIGAPQDGFVQVDCRSVSYFKYVDMNDEAACIRAVMEMYRAVQAMADLKYVEQEKFLDMLSKKRYLAETSN